VSEDKNCLACAEEKAATHVRSDGKYLRYLCADHTKDHDDAVKISNHRTTTDGEVQSA